MQNIDYKDNFGFLAFLAIAACIGIYGRFISLGASPLAVDEYFIAQSVNNILQHGWPMFDCGGYYTRGLMHQYVAAALQFSGVEAEVAIRTVSLIANLAAIPVIYLLGRKVGGREAALVVVAIFFLSTWEIEYSRFGRMYSLFQLAFLWHIWFLLQSMNGNVRAYYTCIAISLVSLLIYEGGALLLILNFVPLVASATKGRFTWPASIFALGGGFLFLRQDFRALGADNSIPDDYSASLATQDGWILPIDEPILLIERLGMLPAATVMLMSIAVLALLFVIQKNAVAPIDEAKHETELGTTIWLIVVVAGGALNLFLLVFMISLVFWLWGWHSFGRPVSRTNLLAAAWLAFCLVAWTMFYLFFTDYGEPADPSMKELVRTLFLYPDIYSEVAYRWIKSMPITSLIMIGSIFTGIYASKTRKWAGESAESFKFFAGLLVALIFLVTIFPQPYASLRYTFFLYPLVLLAGAGAWFGILSLFDLSGRRKSALAITAAIAFCVLSEDVSVAHVRNITSPEVLFRTSMNKWQTDVVYRRWDYKSPAVFVNSSIAPDDQVITTMHSVPYYLDRIDYMYQTETSPEFLVLAACGARKELWSNANLVYKEDKLRQLVWNRSFDTWLIIRAPGRAEAQPIEAEISQEFENSLQYMSLDERIAVYYLPRQIVE